MPALLRNLLSFALLTGVLIAAYGWGCLLAAWLRPRLVEDPRHPRFWKAFELILFSLAIGWGILAHLTLLLGALGLFYRRFAALILAIGVLLALHDLYRRLSLAGGLRPFLRDSRLPQIQTVGPFGILLALCVLLGWVYPLFADALAPPLSWDEVAYHLAIPRLFLRSHAVIYIPFIPYANWPMETEMLYSLGLLLQSELLPHLITWSALLLTSATLLYYGRKFFGLQAGLLAAAIFAAAPMVLNLAGEGLIELPLTLFVSLSTLLMIDWLRASERRKWALSAIFGGLAASTKLNAAVVPLILALFMASYRLVVKRESLRETLLHFSLYGLIAFLIVLPWYVKTWAFTGNPFWPFFFNLFGGKNWDALGNEYLFGFIQLPNMALTPLNWLLGLWEMAKNPEKFGPVGIRTGWLYLGLLPVGLAGMLLTPKGQKRKVLHWLAFTCLVYYTSWFFQTHQARFFMPAAAIWAVFLAGGARQLWEWTRQRWQGLGQAVVQAGLAIAIVAALWPFSAESRQAFAAHWAYISGQESRSQHLEKLFPGYAVYDYANKNLPQDALAWLALYESRGYYLDRNYLWANPISQRLLPLENLSTPEDLANNLAQHGVTHIIFRRANLERYTYIRYGPQVTQLVLNMLDQYGKLQYSAGDLELYRLKVKTTIEVTP